MGGGEEEQKKKNREEEQRRRTEKKNREEEQRRTEKKNREKEQTRTDKNRQEQRNVEGYQYIILRAVLQTAYSSHHPKGSANSFEVVFMCKHFGASDHCDPGCTVSKAVV